MVPLFCILGTLFGPGGHLSSTIFGPGGIYLLNYLGSGALKLCVILFVFRLFV